MLIKATVAALFILRSPTAGQVSALFPLNPPAWSLFFELFVNLVFVIIGRRLSTLSCIGIVAVSAIWLAVAAAQQGSLNIGAGWPTFVDGFPRVLFSIFAGVLVARWLPETRRRVAWAAILPDFLSSRWLFWRRQLGSCLSTWHVR